MLNKEKKNELMRIYLQQGRRAITPLCRDLGIKPQSIANYAANMGLYRGMSGRTAGDPRWARAIAVGKVVA